MTPSSQAVDTVFKAIQDFVRIPHSQEIESFVPLLDDWGIERRDMPPTDLPVLSHLDATLSRTNATTRALTKVLLDNRKQLNWRQSFNKNDITGAKFLNEYGWTDVVGKIGPLVSSKVRAGFVIWAPKCYYPNHAHVAEELYVILSGTGEWEHNDVVKMQPPGACFLHRKMEWHATRAFDEPVLAFYMWRNGDLLEKPSLDKPAKIIAASTR
jgi:mannose-6-phosphate isomerase-like protein (cupin superfamily)